MREEVEDKLIIGRITGVFGVKGWVRIKSFMENPESIFDFAALNIRRNNVWDNVVLQQEQRQGKSLIARITGCEDRDRASEFIGADIAVAKTDLPQLAEGEYYWRQLIGLTVVNRLDISFGTVRQLVETGANDVLVVQGEQERLIPYIDSVIDRVDLEEGRIYVDWDEDF